MATTYFLDECTDTNPATGGFTDAAILMFGLPVPIFWTEKSEALNLTTVGGAVQGYLKYFTWGD